MNQGELTLPATRASGLGFAGRIRRSGLIAPALIFAIVVTQAPFVLTIWFSLQKWNLLRPENSKFNGIQNYIDLFQVGDFVPALINTVIMTSTAVIASLLLGLLMADHGEAHGEDGRRGHRLAHPTVTTVPYAECLLGG